jgi:multidrug resistance efflux pump
MMMYQQQQQRDAMQRMTQLLKPAVRALQAATARELCSQRQQQQQDQRQLCNHRAVQGTNSLAMLAAVGSAMHMLGRTVIRAVMTKAMTLGC